MPSDEHPDWQDQRKKIIGLGESSLRKSYYPELKEKIAQLEKANRDLNLAYKQLAEREEDLQQNYKELVHQQQELRESEQRYRTLIETTDTGFVILDTDGHVIEANRKYVEFSGHDTFEEIAGRPIFAWIVESEREKNLTAFSGLLKDRYLRNFISEYQGKTGESIPIEVNAAILPYGGTDRILALCRDITSRRKAEKALSDSENFYRTVFNTTGSASIIMDRDTRILQANEGFAQLSGYSIEELIGNHYWKEFVTRDEYQRMNDYYRQRRDRAESAPTSYEFRFITRSGTVHYCIMHVAIVPGTEQIIISVIDITDRVIAEKEHVSAKKHLEAIYEGSPDLIFVHEAEGRLLDVNENVLRAFGMTREEILQADPQELCGRGYTADKAASYIREALKKGQADFAWVSRKKNGEEFPVEIRLRRIEYINERGETEPRILAISRDMTERWMAENALELARKKLGLLNTVIFQDIQSTVFALSAYIQLSGSSRDGTTLTTYLDKEAFLISKIVSSLNFTKNYQDLGMQPPKWQNVGQVFLYAISHLDSLKITRHMDVEGLEIFADMLLENVFFNLVENSFVHGQRVTEVSLTFSESDTGLTLILTDNGIGIPDEKKPKIFEHDGGMGGGLGLFLVREILSITRIGIRETGDAGKGVRFELLVPKGAYRFSETVPDKL